MADNYENLMSDDDFRELAEVAHQLHELEQTPAYQTLMDLVRLDYETRQKRVLRGDPKTLEEYRFETGYIAGAMAALRTPERIRERYRGETERRTPEPVTETDDERMYAQF